MPRAFTRAVSPRLAECELTHLERVPIDAGKAVEQHAAYERALADAGFEIVRLDELPNDPDAVFVEDTAVVLGEHVVITRPGVASRLGEADSTAAGLAGHFEVHRIHRGFVDGGDVLLIDRTLYVGLSTRTDSVGIEALREIAAPLGYKVVQAELRGCLHLKTGATFAGPDAAGRPVLLFSPELVDAAQFEGVEALAVEERRGANCVRAGERLILAAGNPRTAELLTSRGFHVTEVDVSELQKAESAVTCMSLIDDRP
jgi:dimethylargininase